MKNIQFIKDDDVDRLLTQELACAAVEKGLVAHANGQCEMPLKPYIRPGGREHETSRGRYIAMPAWVGGDVGAVGVKWIASMPSNLARGLARASGLVILNDVDTGVPIAIMECATLSARRTGAVAALAWRHLGIAADVVSIIGAGPIGEEVILALNAQSKAVGEFRLFDLDQTRALRLRDRIQNRLNCALEVASSLEQCFDGATSIITATTASKGYIETAWVRDARLMVPLSLDDFKADALLSADKVVVDDFDQCVREEKLFHQVFRDGRFKREQVYAQLGQIVAGHKKGRIGSERIYVNCMGLAVEDIAVAKAVYDRFFAI